MNLVDVIKGPIITEKGTLVNELGNQVVFRVDPRANKVEIRQAVERLFRSRSRRFGPAGCLERPDGLGRAWGVARTGRRPT